MESSKLNNITTVKTVGRDRPFFDLYNYCFRFRMDELSCVKEMEHGRIDRMIDHRNQWRQRSPNFGGSWQGRRGQITSEQKSNCHAMLDFLLSHENYKLVVSGDWGYIYTNDMALIRSTESLPYVRGLGIQQCILDRPRDTLRIQNSQHEFRTYFRAQRLEERQRHSLVDFLKSQEAIRFSPGLAEFVTKDQKHYYINENFFIDHDGLGMLVMLGLVLPRATRKTVKLIRDK